MHPPLVAGATTLPPLRGGTTARAYCRDAYEESVSRCFILPPEQWEVRRSRKGEGERSEPIRRMLIIPYDIESQSRNADFNKLAAKPPPQPSGQRPVKLKNPPANGRSILRTFLFTTLLHNLPPTGGYNLRPGGPSTFLFITLLHNPRRKPRPFLICARQGATTTLGLKGRQT